MATERVKAKGERGKICIVCDQPITKIKGSQSQYHARELQRGAHVKCDQAVGAILREYNMQAVLELEELPPPNSEFAALFAGIIELFQGELEETEAVKDYRRRRKESQAKIDSTFLGFIDRLKAQIEKQKEVGMKKGDV